MNVQSASGNSFSMEQVQKQVVLDRFLKGSEVYFSTDIKYVGVITKGSASKINSEMLLTALQCICGAP